MRITIKHEEQRVTIEDKGAVDVHDTWMLCYQAIMSLGYHPNSVKDGLYALDEEINSDKFTANES
jgi:hypothetical protein